MRGRTQVGKPTLFFQTKLGSIYRGDALDLMRELIPNQSIDLIMTSPPFGLVRKKSYGNVDAHEYVDWFRQFGFEFRRILKQHGSLVIDIGGAWIPGQPTKSLYHFELLIMLCKEIGFHLAQEFFWWSPSKLPTPAEWVTVRRIRVKDAVNCIWWLGCLLFDHGFAYSPTFIAWVIILPLPRNRYLTIPSSVLAFSVASDDCGFHSPVVLIAWHPDR